VNFAIPGTSRLKRRRLAVSALIDLSTSNIGDLAIQLVAFKVGDVAPLA
jgi:hypothetical protein